MSFPIGGDNFGDVRKNKLDFVDKSLFIKELLDNRGVSVSVIIRPRRFGKTLNLSMLQHFLANEVNGLKTKHLFDGLKVSKIDNGSYMQYQGKFPAIFVSFKEIKDDAFPEALKGMRRMLKELFRSHIYLLDSTKLTQNEKDIFTLYKDDDQYVIDEVKGSLRFLCEILQKHFGKKVWLLIDEYDTPIQAGYLNDYYAEIIDIMRGIFGAALKSNPFLDRAVVTGILRIAKESLFSGVNNLVVYSMLDQRYGEYFGFTEAEVKEVLEKAKLSDKEQEVKHWYNGYVFAGVTVYNPWSIVNYVTNNGSPKAYWVNTGDNALIKTLLAKSDAEFKRQFAVLMQGKSESITIDTNMVFGDLRSGTKKETKKEAKKETKNIVKGSIKEKGSINSGNSKAVWSLLLMSGYLKVISVEKVRISQVCRCAIPNEEIRLMYAEIIENWIGNGRGEEWYQKFIYALLEGNIENFENNLSDILNQTMSYHDPNRDPEAFYHGFILGLVALLSQNDYDIKSNRESGGGRYDVAIMPKDTEEAAIILEFKRVKKTTPKKDVKKALIRDAKIAREQIDTNEYANEIIERGYKNIVKIGMAFYGKKLKVCSELPIKQKPKEGGNKKASKVKSKKAKKTPEKRTEKLAKKTPEKSKAKNINIKKTKKNRYKK